MFDAYWYGDIYANGVLILTLLAAIQLSQNKNSGFSPIANWSLAIMMTLFIGTRPISGVFWDTVNYAFSFERAAKGLEAGYTDEGFNWLMETSAQFVNVETFFVICAAIYVVPLAIGMQKIHGRWSYIAILCLIGAGSFMPYATNGIRNGMATSLVILGFACYRQKLFMILFFLLAYSMHKSVLLPIACFLIAGIWANPRTYVGIWILCLFTTIVGGSVIASRVTALTPVNEEDMRLADYVSMGSAGKYGGFRWDFILNAILPVIVSRHLAVKNALQDKFYQRLLCTYLAANAYWVLVMQVGFSNRFAYLSWFMTAWVVIYPHLPPKDSRLMGEENWANRCGFLLLFNYITACYSFYLINTFSKFF
jgi:hypothetical protein